MTGAARTYERILVTGGAGFIGSSYVRDVLARRDGTRITVLDKLTYAGNEANLVPVRDDPEMAGRLEFVRGDIADAGVVVKESDEPGWTAAIGELLDRPEKRAELAARGLARTAKRFAWPVVARQHLKFFEQLLASR